MLVLRVVNPTKPGREGPYDAFFSGLLGGYMVFGRQRMTSVNQQIVIYVFARVVLALAKLSIEPAGLTRGTPTPTLPSQRFSPEVKSLIERNAWPVFASLSWAFVMYIFRWQPESIQPSLRSSMKYMYVPDVSALFWLAAFTSPFCSHSGINGTLTDMCARYTNADHWDSFRNFLIHNT